MPATFAPFPRLQTRGQTTIAAALIGAAAFGWIPGAAQEHRPETQPVTRFRELTRDPLRFVTWNVQKCEGGRDEVIAELKKLDADVICLQEVIEPREGADSPHQTREIAAALSLDWYSQGGRLDDERDQCLAILCRAPLRGTQSLSTVPERNYAIAATTQWKGRPLRIVCVHLAGTYKLGREHVARTSRARAKDWEALLREAHQWREATVLAGDFNTFPGATQFELLTDMLPFAGDPGPTFPSRSPALRLDHVLSTPDLAVLSILCVDTQVSDHRPVSVEFTLKSRPDPKDPGPASQTQTQAVRGTAPERN